MKAFIVDDERLARTELRRLLTEHPEIEIAGEARNGEEALALVAQFSPDLLFLDIQMPQMSGFDVLERLDDVPQVIFTTAYDAYAIKAFEVNALDYLMKPIAPARLAAALARSVRDPDRREWSEFRARWGPLLDRRPARYFSAGIRWELHARALQRPASADPAIAQRTGGADWIPPYFSVPTARRS